MSKETKRKWEIEYEKWTAGEYDEKLNELQGTMKGEYRSRKNYDGEGRVSKIAKREMTKEDYDEYKRMSAVKENLSKVKNIKELRDKFETQKKTLQEELKRRKSKEAFKSEVDKLEKENEKLLLENDKLEEDLKKASSPEEKADITKKLAENKKARQENNDKYYDAQQKMPTNEPEKKMAYMNLSTQELEKNVMILGSRISKCNMACSNLMDGKSWEAVEAKLDNWKENLTGSKKQADTIKGTAKDSSEQQKDEESLEEEQAEETGGFRDDEELEESTDLAKVEEKKGFAKLLDRFKNSRLGKTRLGKWISGKLEKTTDEKDEKGEENKESDKKSEKQENESKSNYRDDDFRAYLKAVAEKGMEKVDKVQGKKEVVEQAKDFAEKNADKIKEFEEKRQATMKEYSEKLNNQDDGKEPGDD